MCIGQVKWYNTKKGYGFIQPEDDGKDVLYMLPNWKKKELKN